MKYDRIESKILEFKERLSDYSRLIETITAFSNTQGGTIIIGIRDSDREIIGLSPEEISTYHEEIPQAVADAISPQTSVDMFEQAIGGEVCLTIRVFPGPQKPYFIKRHGYPGGIYLRFGSHNRNADTYAVQEFSRQRAGLRYEQTACPQVSYSDLSQDLLGWIFTSCSESLFVGSGYGVTDVSGQTIPNAAGILLFYPAHQEVIPESGISIARFSSRDRQDLIRTDMITGGIKVMLESAYAYLSDILGSRYELSGMVRKPVEFEIPLEAIREVLVNAAAHRAYDYEAPVRISIFPDRIEFLNPGTFYAPINQENLKEGLSRYRNPLIADALRKTGYMEKQGIGISLIISSCLEAGLREPEFVELENHVKVILYREQREVYQHEPFDASSTYEERIRYHFTSRDSFTSSEAAQYLGRSQATAKNALQRLQQEGTVKKFGKGPATRYRVID